MISTRSLSNSDFGVKGIVLSSKIASRSFFSWGLSCLSRRIAAPASKYLSNYLDFSSYIMPDDTAIYISMRRFLSCISLMLPIATSIYEGSSFLDKRFLYSISHFPSYSPISFATSGNGAFMFCAQYESSPVQSRSNVLVSVFEEDVGAVPVEF